MFLGESLIRSYGCRRKEDQKPGHRLRDAKLRDAPKILKKYENKPAGTLVQDILAIAPKLIGEKKVDIFKMLLQQDN